MTRVGGYVVLGMAGVRRNQFANVTVADGGTLELLSTYADIADTWTLTVGAQLLITLLIFTYGKTRNFI